MTPHWRSNVSVAMSAPASAPVWETAARAPAAVRPLLTARIGFLRVMRRASVVNRDGLPNDSRYIRIRSMPASFSQCSSRSLPEISVLLPSETKWAIPRPRSAAVERIASPSAPLWDRKPMRPGTGRAAAKEALRRTSGSVLIRPMQLGPTMRMPYLRTSRKRRFSSCAPSAPASRKPAVITTSPRTFFRPQERTTSRTCSLGTTITARSTGSGMASTDG